MHFQSTYCFHQGSCTYGGCSFASDDYVDMSAVTVSADDVLSKLAGLSLITGGCTPDELPPCFLCGYEQFLSEPLACIFNKSLRLGLFPDFWKLSFVIPLHKSGSRSEEANYRGISIASVIPKIDEQHGIYKGHSTGTNLFLFNEYVHNAFECDNYVDCLYTDLTKAFDRVNIDTLLSKLQIASIEYFWLSFMLVKVISCGKRAVGEDWFGGI